MVSGEPGRLAQVLARDIRLKVPTATQAEVLVRSRRRCCICFGLFRDDGIKKGQIAHLDKDSSNNAISNLAFLCFNHHDEFDTITRQSKGIASSEIAKYREELHDAFSGWMSRDSGAGLLHFLSDSIDLPRMAEVAMSVGSRIVFNGPEHALHVLTTADITYLDPDLYIPHLIALDHFASWGWLTFEETEYLDANGSSVMHIQAVLGPVCGMVANQIRSWLAKHGDIRERRAKGMTY